MANHSSMSMGTDLANPRQSNYGQETRGRKPRRSHIQKRESPETENHAQAKGKYLEKKLHAKGYKGEGHSDTNVSYENCV